MRFVYVFGFGMALGWAIIPTQSFAEDSARIPEVTNRAEQERIVKQSCSMNDAKNRGATPVSDIFIDYRFLPMAIGSKYDPKRSSWPYVMDYDVIRFLLRSGFSAIETQKDFFLSSTRELPSATPILRFEVMAAGASACRNWPDQYSAPLVFVPTLRMLGLHSDQCIGIRELPRPTAEGRIEVKRNRLYLDPSAPSDFRWRLDIKTSVKVRDGVESQLNQSVMHLNFPTVGQHGEAKYVLGCGTARTASSSSDVTDISNSLPPNGRGIFAPPPILIRRTKPPTIEPAQLERISSIRWLKTQAVETGNNRFYDIDSKGVIWTAPTPESPLRWGVYVAQRDRILFSPIPAEQPQLFYSTRALGVTSGNGYAAILELNTKPAEIRLFEFDNDLNLIGIFRITPSQLSEIINKAKLAT